ncbi:MAG: type II secretion system protein N [Steroidobacteraceae bacterium]
MLNMSKAAAIPATPAGRAWVAIVQRGPTILAAVLVVGMAVEAATVAWRFLSPPEQDTMSAAAPAAEGPVNLAAVVNAHLFGRAPQVAQGEGPTPVSTARLVLVGTLAGTDPDEGWAILGETAQAARVYRSGTALPGGIRLKEVYPDRVILDRGGRLEVLNLPRISVGGGSPAMAMSRTRPLPTADRVRSAVSVDRGGVSELFRPPPVFAGGQQKGYRLYPGRNRAQFATLGLRPGDLVTAVNGAPLDDPARGMETLRGLSSGGPVNLTIERNGVEQQVTIDPSAAIGAQDDSNDNAEPETPPSAGAPEPETE